ncbi:MAG: isoprenyl transferase [Deltaproteobacteria bacterium]|nr:isoprenyl transferase [Deltaproteobacteria bacterium]
MDLRGLDMRRLPNHVAIIMDGNGRWARLRGKSRIEGHRRGRASVRAVVELSRKLGIPYLSLYAFSTENWLRPKDEVNALMGLLRHYLAAEQPKMMRHGIRLLAIGEKSRLPAPVLQTLNQAVRATRKNKGMTVVLALSYSGRHDIVRMVQGIARKVKEGRCAVKDINERMVSGHMETCSIPDPDLLIRTSGEMRISNFFLWQIPYTELYVTPTLWPDFREGEYVQALKEYQRRRRRFGRTDEQIDRGLSSLVQPGGLENRI